MDQWTLNLATKTRAKKYAEAVGRLYLQCPTEHELHLEAMFQAACTRAGLTPDTFLTSLLGDRR